MSDAPPANFAIPGASTELLPSDEDIRASAEEHFSRRPCHWQCKVCRLILEGHDVVCIAPTGAGKTLSFWLPLLFKPDGIIVVITPLNILGSQNRTQLEALGIKAISLDAQTATKENVDAVEEGRYQAVVVNPEIAFGYKGPFEHVWKSTKFADKLTVVVFDEAHCVSSWGTWRPHYTHADRLRTLIPTVPFLLPSATLPRHVRDDVLGTLQMKQGRVREVRLSNDRPNIYLSVRRIEHAVNSYKDLEFLIPKDWKPGDKIPKFVIFFDSIADSIDAADFLRSRLPPEYCDKLVWFNSNNSAEYREITTEEMKNGDVFGLTCTDAFGMGVDLSDIEIIIQWKCTCNMDTLWQRFGRAARDAKLEAIAILFVEAKYFDEEREKATERARKEEKKRADKAAQKEIGKRKASNSEQGRASKRSRRTGTGEGDGSSDTDSEADVERLSLFEKLRVEYVQKMPKVQTDKVKKTSSGEIGPELDNMVNARGRGIGCYRAPITAFYENDRLGENDDALKCLDCARCNPAPSPVCCELCWLDAPKPSPRHNPFAILPPLLPSTAEAPGPRTIAKGKGKMEGDQSSRASTLPKTFKYNETDIGLRNALHEFRRDRAILRFGSAVSRNNFAYGLIMGDETLLRLIACAREHKICSVDDLRRETKWTRAGELGEDVVGILHRFYPISESETEPVLRDVDTNVPAEQNSGEQPRKSTSARHCSGCGSADHISSNSRCPQYATYLEKKGRLAKENRVSSATPSTPSALPNPPQTSPSSSSSRPVNPTTPLSLNFYFETPSYARREIRAPPLLPPSPSPSRPPK